MMGKLQEFQITLNSNKVVYSPGESISGTVKISTAQPIQCKGSLGSPLTRKAIKVNFPWVMWRDQQNERHGLARGGTVLQQLSLCTLKQGEHIFPFKFLIPATAPTSYEGAYGKIMYKIRAFLDTPRFSKDYKIEKPFYMLNKVNLNDVPEIYEPNTSTITKNFSYMLVKNGTVVLVAKTDQRGYTEGQVIKVSAEIDNQSGKNTGHVVAGLIQRVTYRTKKPTHEVRMIAEVEGAGVKAGKRAEWKEQIIVPPLPLSSLAGCNLIEINYFIQVSLKYPEMLLTLPIHIGNVAVDPSLRPPPKASKTAPTPAPRTTPASPTSLNAPAATPPPSASPSLPPRPAPRPRPRSMVVTPSAPPVDPDMMGAGDRQSEEIPTKVHSQHQGPMSPSAFSYAPGLVFPQNNINPSAPHFSFSTGATIPFFSEGNGPPVPTTCSFILPPDYRGSAHPHEPPPSYEDSFPTT
ncbi:hypothetical protein QTP86_020167 [Hemibagrus guttatus]|nr:hypothetical protein QTP86_020167 [Hemibagrus guttatus]